MTWLLNWAFLLVQLYFVGCIRLPLDFTEPHVPAYRVFYVRGNSEDDLPVCSKNSVCNKVDIYDSPWIERQCRCPTRQKCSMSLNAADGHSITDKTRIFKMCEPISSLPKCRYFRDITWTFINDHNNGTRQFMHCLCLKKSVAYIIKRNAYQGQHGTGYKYSFACAPQSKLRCQRKEPCKLFTVKKRPTVDEVNTNTLCQCPHNHTCPTHHTEAGVIPGKMYIEDQVRTYSGYCIGGGAHLTSASKKILSGMSKMRTRSRD